MVHFSQKVCQKLKITPKLKPDRTLLQMSPNSHIKSYFGPFQPKSWPKVENRQKWSRIEHLSKWLKMSTNHHNSSKNKASSRQINNTTDTYYYHACNYYWKVFKRDARWYQDDSPQWSTRPNFRLVNSPQINFWQVNSPKVLLLWFS